MSEFEHINVSLDEVGTVAALRPILEQSAQFHHHLCPRQVLGVRIGLLGLELLNFSVPIRQKKLLVLVETDGCFVSGVQAATGCSVNRRTLRVVDIGRIGATFVNVKTEEALRIAPRYDVRERALAFVSSSATSRRARYIAMLQAYQQMPVETLLAVEAVALKQSVQTIISRPFLRVDCTICGEEIINQRERLIDGQPVCQACAGDSYYTPLIRQSY